MKTLDMAEAPPGCPEETPPMAVGRGAAADGRRRRVAAGWRWDDRHDLISSARRLPGGSVLQTPGSRRALIASKQSQLRCW